MMQKDAKIYVAGHRGLVGSAIVRSLKSQGYKNIVGKSHSELNLMSQGDTFDFFAEEQPEYVFLAAAKVGGIHANNTYPADFIYSNLQIQCSVIEACKEFKVKKMLFLGSVCIYPKNAQIPVKEESLLTGALEPTNIAYAIAKIAGLTMCQSYNKQFGTNFISCMPANLYGINDNYHPTNSHVLPGLMRRFHEAKINNLSEVEIWGSGKPFREFLFSEDMAEACVFLMNNYDKGDLINIGSGQEVKIAYLAKLVKEAVGYEGEIVFDHSKPDGTFRRMLDSSKIQNLGWMARTELRAGLKTTYEDFLTRYGSLSK